MKFTEEYSGDSITIKIEEIGSLSDMNIDNLFEYIYGYDNITLRLKAPADQDQAMVIMQLIDYINPSNKFHLICDGTLDAPYAKTIINSLV
jgi:hypothetical protein